MIFFIETPSKTTTLEAIGIPSDFALAPARPGVDNQGKCRCKLTKRTLYRAWTTVGGHQVAEELVAKNTAAACAASPNDLSRIGINGTSEPQRPRGTARSEKTAMTITGKLFGALGHSAQTNSAPTSETSAPSYGDWCAQKIAQSYEAQQRRRRSAQVVQLFQQAPRTLQMAA
jgi:hypothetical protein